MRFGEAMAYAAVAVSLTAVGSPSLADDAPAPPLPPMIEARPPPPPTPPPAPVAWQHHIEVGGGVAFSEMLASVDGASKATPVRFAPGVGFHVDLSWQVFHYLRFTGYLVEHANALELPAGSLGVPGTINSSLVHSYAFGVRFSPTLPIGSRTRLWLTAGAGWGYLGYDRFTIANQPDILIRDRSAMIFEIPVGVGGSIMLIPRLLSVHFELTGSFVPSQTGDALDQGQYIDAGGMTHDLGPMPRLDASFVQTLGLSLHL
jgi:hypothetical protein